MKKARQKKILEIIESNDVETQFQLISLLTQAGFDGTQATVSRDIKELRLIKEQTARGIYRYKAGDAQASIVQTARLRTFFKDGVTSCENAQNIVVLKTIPGLAPAACGAIDSMKVNAIVGSIAGDDTAFLAMKDTKSAEDFCKEIEEMLK